MNIKEALAILALPQSASDKELQTAYRKGVKQWHPDRFQQQSEDRRLEAEAMMRELNLAFEVLSEQYKKQGHLRVPLASSMETRPAPEPVREPPPPAAPPLRPTADRTAQPPPRKSSRGGVWLGLIALVVVGYLVFSGLFDDYAEQAVIYEPKRESQQELAASSERKNEPKPEAEPAMPAYSRLGDSMSYASNPEQKQQAAEEKTAFDSRSAFTHNEAPAKTHHYFTYGDTIGRVYEIQGIPTRTNGDTWYYGNSAVHFKDGRVVAWENTHNIILKARDMKMPEQEASELPASESTSPVPESGDRSKEFYPADQSAPLSGSQ